MRMIRSEPNNNFLTTSAPNFWYTFALIQNTKDKGLLTKTVRNLIQTLGRVTGSTVT